MGICVALRLLFMGINKGEVMKYGVAWLLGVPISLVAVWFVLNQVGCGM